ETAQTVFQRPQILTERNARKVSALSLKSIQKKQQLQEEFIASQPEKEDFPSEKFSEDEMRTAWHAYSQLVEKEGKFNLLSHLTMGTPRLEGHIIHLEFPNHTIKTEVERAKFELLGFLREKLQNYKVD